MMIKIKLRILLLTFALTLLGQLGFAHPPSRWNSFKTLLRENVQGQKDLKMIGYGLGSISLYALYKFKIKAFLHEADLGDPNPWLELLADMLCAGASVCVTGDVLKFYFYFEEYHAKKLREFDQMKSH